ncbi:protein kinase [Cordyceps javanica]|nr:protein kinase [Cordyceps javanica]
MSTHSSSCEEDFDLRFFLPQGVGDTEDVEGYRAGGFHPVHLGDTFDGKRYKVVHKLGAGGFSTVWLARDDKEHQWVALKIIDAAHSTPTADEKSLGHAMLRVSETERVVVHRRQFAFDGPNGHHLCLVLPVLGPSLSALSYCWDCRLTPWFARRAAYQAIRAVADLHSQGLYVTTGNLLLGLVNLDCYEENDIYELFGRPVTGGLQTESGEMTGTEAPRYIVKSIDFLSAPSNVVRPDVKLVDFDQCFSASSPPEKMLGTPLEYLAPEVAVGLSASPASDVWALGCCILQLRSGAGPFSSPFDVTCPADLICYIVNILEIDMPHQWQDILWDDKGRPTKDSRKGRPLNMWSDGRRSLRGIVYNTWDEPNGRAIYTGNHAPKRDSWLRDKHKPLQSSWSKMAWNPKAVKVDDAYLSYYDDGWDKTLESLPKIPDHEATLLLDLLSSIFVYDPAMRPTAKELLEHPWFHLDSDSL